MWEARSTWRWPRKLLGVSPGVRISSLHGADRWSGLPVHGRSDITNLIKNFF